MGAGPEKEKMRKAFVTAAAGVALLTLAACNRNEEAAETPAEAPAATAPAPAAGETAAAPQRRPGLWEQRVSTEGMVQVSRICIDEALEKRIGWWGQQATADACEKNQVTRRADGGWQFSSVCDMGTGGKTTTSGVATGDFNSRYLVEAESSTVGAEAPQMNGVRKMIIESAWQGPCPEGFEPGDMELPGGMRINLLDMGGG